MTPSTRQSAQLANVGRRRRAGLIDNCRSAISLSHDHPGAVCTCSTGNSWICRRSSTIGHTGATTTCSASARTGETRGAARPASRSGPAIPAAQRRGDPKALLAFATRATWLRDDRATSVSPTRWSNRITHDHTRTVCSWPTNTRWTTPAVVSNVCALGAGTKFATVARVERWRQSPTMCRRRRDEDQLLTAAIWTLTYWVFEGLSIVHETMNDPLSGVNARLYGPGCHAKLRQCRDDLDITRHTVRGL